jgi:hypothetical protein
MRDLAEQLLPGSSADSKAAGKAASAEAKAQKRAGNHVPKLPSPGRQSVLKAGMSRFHKSKDKKAA